MLPAQLPVCSNVVFFNHFRNGDLFVSRGLVRYVVQTCKVLNKNIDFHYMHKNPNNLLEDVDDLSYVPQTKATKILDNMKEHEGIYLDPGTETLFFNTWYATGYDAFIKVYGITFDCLYYSFCKLCEILEIPKPEPEEVFPNVLYEKVTSFTEIENTIKDKFANKQIILVCNGHALSGHSSNVDLLSATCEALKQKNISQDDVVVLYTDEEQDVSTEGYQLVKTSSILPTREVGKSDLLQHSIIARHAKIIIGRCSGAYTYSFTHQSLFVDEDKTFITFTNLDNPTWLGNNMLNLLKYKAKIISSKETAKNKIRDIIANAL